jgi:lipopolysaccharide/colanic/teichoic acid biosynthesis glycosyltransferase
MGQPLRVLQLAAADITAKKLLLPLIDRLVAEGYQVYIACSDGRYARELAGKGYRVFTVPIGRQISPLANARALWHLYRLMRRERFDIVHVHTPVAAALGRVAAWMARVPIVIYTAHGFYFHDDMRRWLKQPIIWVEKLLGKITDLTFTQSQEDAITAAREGISEEGRVVRIGNGVDIERFIMPPANDGVRMELGLSQQDKIVGFVGRLVREKGLLELIEAVKEVAKVLPDTRLVLVGETLDGDRDQKAKQALRQAIEQDGLQDRVVFTGFVEDIPRVMAAIDLFVLPSYREGMPRTIIEAMACGKPVVATNIRGCREEVVHGVTGMLVPVKDAASLAEAMKSVLSNPDLAQEMGRAGQQRAVEMFDERTVLDRQMEAYRHLVDHKLSQVRSLGTGKKIQCYFKWAMDLAASSASLLFLTLPFLAIAALVKLDSPGPAFFRQERVGKYGKPFQVWKFRTMEDGAIDRGLGVNVARDDPRITRVGKVLRGWGLDELPQLINVLKGEMSIVGPRPTLGYQVEMYDDFQRRRLLAKPGITSLAGVNGRNLLPWTERIQQDVWYVDNWSMWLDMKIILKTLWTVLVTRQGIYGVEGINDDFVSTQATNARRKP